MAKNNLKPWTPAPISWQYVLTWPRWWVSWNPEITAIKWKTLPPTQKPWFTYTLIDVTKHKN